MARQKDRHLSLAEMTLPDDLVARVTGRFYTHKAVAEHLISALEDEVRRTVRDGDTLSVCDPFAGDGRLVRWLVEHWRGCEFPLVNWRVFLWDLDKEALSAAAADLRSYFSNENIEAEMICSPIDAFRYALEYKAAFDIVLTNPPWENLKPDVREIGRLPSAAKEKYVASMREYDLVLAATYPESQPLRKFAGWGTNLSRVGLDVCRLICKPGGHIAIVMPASFLADDQSIVLRRAFLSKHTLVDAAYFPAEARLFGRADVSASTLLFRMGAANGLRPRLTTYTRDLEVRSQGRARIEKSFLEQSGHVLPISIGPEAIKLLQKLSQDFPPWQDLEGDSPQGLWAGRELDETSSSNWLVQRGRPPLFIKGRMIGRYVIRCRPKDGVSKPGWTPPPSTAYKRIAWRDVSRPSQKRRMIATTIESGLVAGNSLGVAYFRDGNDQALKALLGIMNSFCFEIQLRSRLATGHISLSSLRKVHVPPRSYLASATAVVEVVEKVLAGEASAAEEVEAIVAGDVYGLSRDELILMLGTFPRLTAGEGDAVLAAYDARYQRRASQNSSGGRDLSTNSDGSKGLSKGAANELKREIRNHVTASLSALDLQMVGAVPPGGNWKNIPESIPSRRLEQIRQSFKEGKGSRSTYYGRLHPDRPAYTISTYFNRPGNGCHIHYLQDRVLSHREAARLQSFPDSFTFFGSQSDVNKQIGNAVPPLLAYQIACSLGEPGYFVDLFSGAGGLALGFKWAGWRPVVVNDIEPRFLETYSRNVHERVIVGSITDEDTFQELVSIARTAKKHNTRSRLWVLGGPPCQGFSTAGKRRSLKDERNQLVWHYKHFLEEVEPDGFVFENVPGLMNMHGGSVYSMIREELSSVMPLVQAWILSAEEHAVPQRRRRVILVGTVDKALPIEPPPKLTGCQAQAGLFGPLQPAVSVAEALSDLPELIPGQDGSHLDYSSPPTTAYQAFMRGSIGIREFLSRIKQGIRRYGPEPGSLDS